MTALCTNIPIAERISGGGEINPRLYLILLLTIAGEGNSIVIRTMLLEQRSSLTIIVVFILVNEERIKKLWSHEHTRTNLLLYVASDKLDKQLSIKPETAS